MPGSAPLRGLTVVVGREDPGRLRDLLAAEDPIGPRNDWWLRRLAADAALVVGGWGNHGTHGDRAARVRASLPALHCLRLNGSGEPAHPLYLPKTLTPFPMPDAK